MPSLGPSARPGCLKKKGKMEKPKEKWKLLDKIGKAFINDKLDNKYLKEISKNFIR